jgi:hypothetical protein
MNKITSINDYFKSIKHPNVIIYFYLNSSILDLQLEEMANDYISLGIHFTSIDINELPLHQLPIIKTINIPCFMFFKDGFEICTTQGTNINLVEKMIQNFFLS